MSDDPKTVIAERAASELRSGEIVNLGIGIPNLIPGHLGPDTDIVLHANWAMPGKDVLGVGGAMDLVVGAKRVVVTMTATTPNGDPKLVRECTFPLTARGAVDVVVTEQAVFRFRDGELALTELLGDATLDDVARATEARYAVELEG